MITSTSRVAAISARVKLARDFSAVEEECQLSLARTPVGRSSARRHLGSYYTPEPVVERLLDMVLEPACDSAEAAETDYPAILDPACGSGRFLIAAAQRLARRLSKRFPVTEARCRAAELVSGVDCDAAALAVAHESLRRFAPGSTPRLHCGDGLAGNSGRRFGVIIGNPPWVSFSGRESARTGAVTSGFGRWPSLHGAFLAKAAEWLTPDGRLGFVLPLSTATLPGNGPLRAQVSRCMQLECPVEELPRDAFPGVTQPAGLFSFIANDRAVSSPEAWAVSPRVTAPRVGSFERFLSATARFPRFPAKTFSDPGIHSGNVAGRLIGTIDEATPPDAELIREGRDVHCWGVLPPRRWLRRSIVLAEGEYFRARPVGGYCEFPIILRQTADHPIAARHQPAAGFRNSVLACGHVPGWPVEAILAVLNSRLIADIHLAGSSDARQKTFPQVKIGRLHTLPLPAPNDRVRGCFPMMAKLVLELERVTALRNEAEISSLQARMETLVEEIYEVRNSVDRIDDPCF